LQEVNIFLVFSDLICAENIKVTFLLQQGHKKKTQKKNSLARARAQKKT
jgi:hypothetical protein